MTMRHRNLLTFLKYLLRVLKEEGVPQPRTDKDIPRPQATDLYSGIRERDGEGGGEGRGRGRQERRNVHRMARLQLLLFRIRYS